MAAESLRLCTGSPGMQRFKSARHAQQFLSSRGQIHHLFQLRRHRTSSRL
jgi:hypothetical protein